MTRKSRRVLFYAFVVIFILATPPTILYTMGYFFDWQNYVLVQTGGIYLKSAPSGAQIYFNGKNLSTTPQLISHLKPGRYEITVSKDGFRPWRKNLEVLPSLVSEARNITLFPMQIKPELIAQNVTSTIEYYSSSPEEKQKEPQAQSIASSTAGWLLKDNNLFYISEVNFILYRTDLGGFIKEQLSKESLPNDSYKIVNGGNQFLVLSSQKILYWLNPNSRTFEILASGIKNAQVSSDNKKVLYATDNEIWLFYFENILMQPYKKAGDKELITRWSQPISQTIFYPDNEYVAFVVGEQIKIAELDGRDPRNTVDFISAPGPQIYFDEATSYFYYLTQKELFQLKLKL